MLVDLAASRLFICPRRRDDVAVQGKCSLAACPRNTVVEWSGGIIGVVQQRGAGDEQELPSL